MEDFEKEGIRVFFNDYSHPAYEQIRGNEFVSHLASIDLFMNKGFKKGKEIMMSGNETVNSYSGNSVSLR